jgi:hypothetical protein
MSRGLGRIERAILDLIEDEDASDVQPAMKIPARARLQRMREQRCKRPSRYSAERASHAAGRMGDGFCLKDPLFSKHFEGSFAPS